MELKKIYFDAFKSLVGQELEISNACIGFVGINESGKSNLLDAVLALGGGRTLIPADKPRMRGAKDPKLRYEFELRDEERSRIQAAIKDWCTKTTLVDTPILKNNFNLCYNIEYDPKEKIEKRYFTLTNVELVDGFWILRPEFTSDLFQLPNLADFTPLSKAIVITEKSFKDNDKYFEMLEKLQGINELIAQTQAEIKDMEEKLSSVVGKTENSESSDSTEPAKATSEPPTWKSNTNTVKKAIDKAKNKIQALDKTKNGILENLGKFNYPQMVDTLKTKQNSIQTKIDQLENNIKGNNEAIRELEKKKELSEKESSELESQRKSLIKLEPKRTITKMELRKQSEILQQFTMPLQQKYTQDPEELGKYLERTLKDSIGHLVPQVVFWEHKDEFILPSNSKFSELLAKTSLDEIPRPLVNIFRIGLGIKNLSDLKDKIIQIQEDENERSTLAVTLNKQVKKYIKSVWPEYDQEIKISLEEEQIRFQVFDPIVKFPSHYKMSERSQGAQTFLSFLLTIGVESERGVIKNTILLLDEPETHLHPSGVRFMRKELIKIARNGNLVFYATHSQFMIDEDKYDRHIILNKKDEKTEIQRSQMDRIGYFMQEEVLYKALEIPLGQKIGTSKRCNFVFEGTGDAILFEHYYKNIADPKPFNPDITSFTHGGGCKGITKYFISRPIQLGSKWILILDNDSPAKKLKTFIEGIYNDYIGKDIFIHQYSIDEDSSDVEFEDLLPQSIMVKSYHDVIDVADISIDKTELTKRIDPKKRFAKYHTEIEKWLLNQGIDESIKGALKAALNKNIQESIADISGMDQFAKKFPKYCKWVEGVVNSLADVGDSVVEGKMAQPTAQKAAKVEKKTTSKSKVQSATKNQSDGG